MSYYWFNSNPVEQGPHVGISDYLGQIEATPNLRRASLSNAVLFGGPLLRKLLESAPITGSHKNIFVDTKVSMLMPGWWPAIPGWHTDGVPRGVEGNPLGSGNPSLPAQAERHLDGYRPRYHTLHVGNDCATEFIDDVLRLQIVHDTDPEMYAEMTRLVNELESVCTIRAEQGQWMSWDWWNIHQATQATSRGWRLLVRVTESDDPPADSDFIRPQNQVYVPQEFGW